ncbi:hypothetical protein AB664_01770 [Brucella anthropi]|jgi:hypothetical protein|uniref:Uncharacterized protein n=1 Tax=Brucella anthropi TaxID=529 RepID=A0A656Z757_BRUAN|nr:hypothetical protein AB664_01770 [Brucella anthropi]
MDKSDVNRLAVQKLLGWLRQCTKQSQETAMKLAFLTTAALVLSVTFAMADCPGHSAQSTKMEKPQTTASVETTMPTQK